jgi:hypothetical protein
MANIVPRQVGLTIDGHEVRLEQAEGYVVIDIGGNLHSAPTIAEACRRVAVLLEIPCSVRLYKSVYRFFLEID